MSNGEFMMTIRALLTLSLAGSAAAVGTTAQGVRPGFYVVGTFSGSSMGDDAPIWDARIQGTGAVYVAGGDPALELVVRQKPSAAAPVVAYLGTVKGGDGGLHSIYAANEPNLIGEMERVSHEEYGLVAGHPGGRRLWAGSDHAGSPLLASGGSRAFHPQRSAGPMGRVQRGLS